VTYDLEFKKKLGSDSTIGLFNRGMAFYDDKIYSASNEHNSPFTLNANAFFGGSLTKLDRFTDDTEDRAGRDAKFLDAFVYLNANSSKDYASTLRVGAQVINWGESLFIQSGIGNAVNPADVSQANLPGTEVKEILLPQKAVYGSIALGDAISLEAYYQWEWTNTIAPPAGTFLSTNDFIAEDGGETLLLPPPGPPLAGLVYTRGRDLNPGDGGQYGLAMRWFAESLNSTDFGFYFVNYSSKLPNLALSGTPAPVIPPSVLPPQVGPGTYHIEYFEDIQLYGFSFNTVLWDIAFSGEIAYHKDMPLQTRPIGAATIGMAAALGGAPLSLSTEEDVIVAQLTVNKTFNTTPWIRSWADDVALLLEVGYVTTPDLNDGDVFRGPNPVDENAWGYKSRLTLTYFDWFSTWSAALSGTDLAVQLLFNQDVDGTSVIPAGSFTDNAKSAAIAFTASWQNTLDLDLRYNAFFGDGDLTDRDNVSIGVKYRF
jgi:hypothetical protein